MILEGKSLVVKGKLKQLNKKQIVAMFRHTGALFKDGISYTTDLLVVGETKSDKEHQKAIECHAAVMTEAEFIDRFQLCATIDERWQRLRDLLSQTMDAD